MSNDFDYIKEKFEADGIKAPDSLSEDKILAMLPDAEEIPANDSGTKRETVKAKPPVRRSAVRRYIAIAACAVLALIGVPRLYGIITAPPDTDLVNGELKTFSSYEEIERLADSMDKESSGGLHFFSLGGGRTESTADGSDTDIAAVEDSAPEMSLSTNATSKGAGGTPNHSDTYLQVEEVDEADIVKTDGKYIYYVNENAEVLIYSAENGKTKKLATIGNTGVENYIHDIFLKGDTLVTIGMVYDDYEGSAAIVTYDISDRSKPEVISDFRQSGDIISARMVGDYVYLVTNQYIYSKDMMYPMCYKDGEYSRMPVNDICCVPNPSNKSYVILSAVDIASGKSAKSKSKAIFGSSDTIYCNDHNLYTTVTDYNYKPGSSDNGTSTRIVRASLDGLKIRFDATATVRGYIDDQFAMNEKDGYFYIATTAQRDNMDVNNLFVLDKDLKEAGKVTGFARNESIRAVRYLGDKAYVITYEAIDPRS